MSIKNSSLFIFQYLILKRVSKEHLNCVDFFLSVSLFNEGKSSKMRAPGFIY